MKAIFLFIRWYVLPIHPGNINISVLFQLLDDLVNFFRQTLQFGTDRSVVFIPYPASHTIVLRQMGQAVAETYALHVSGKADMFLCFSAISFSPYISLR